MLKRILDALQPKPTANALVLGFYNRDNLGDELYKLAVPHLLRNAATAFTFSFQCTDDIEAIPEGTDLVICGGGDIINAYFMTKVKALIANFTGPVIALSVGIPYDDDLQYLHLFDHVYARSTRDFQRAVATIGADNVTQMRDAVFGIRALLEPLKTTRLANRLALALKPKQKAKQLDIGISIAAPYFSKFPHLLSDIKDLCKLLLRSRNTRVHFFAFNTHVFNHEECDTYIIEELLRGLEGNNVVVHTNPTKLVTAFQTMDVHLCMRYHSAILALMFGIPFVTLHSTPKIDSLLQDFEYPEHLRVTPAIAQPDMSNYLLAKLGAALNRSALAVDVASTTLPVPQFPRYKAITYRAVKHTLQEAITNVVKMLDAYTHQATTHDHLHSVGAFPTHGRLPMETARIICYAITGDPAHDCSWGLTENMQKNDFVLYDAIKYIHEQHDARASEPAVALPRLPPAVQRRCLLNVDPYSDKLLHSKVHRSGWAYVVGHLMNLDATLLMRNATIVLDTYVDRTFHWAHDVVQTIAAVPYKTPWVGIVHHTFDTTHSEYNCATLFSSPTFLASLDTCRGLVALSDYLARQLRAALAETAPHVAVHTIYHPTEFPTKMFSWEAYAVNPQKKLVHIGAWLRRPYSIYTLDLPPRYGITKAALKGKNMDAYFPPQTYTPEQLLPTPTTSTSPSYTCDQASRGTTTNKFIEGVYDTLKRHLDSVETIGPLSNDAYDELLSQNIVFLDLVDCSAVNTAIECIVRNTPLIVNRHPALEELLGASYPGFYDALADVVFLLDPNNIQAIYCSLQRLDKSRFDISTFLNSLQDFVLRRA